MGKIKSFFAGIFKKKPSEFELLLEAASGGKADAQFELALCYDEGKGVEEDKYKAFKWFKKAADQGHARAQNAVGLCYEYGDGVEKNMNEAIRWYKISIENGCTKAMLSMAGVYANKGENDKAWVLIDRAASMGNEDAKRIQKQMGR